MKRITELQKALLFGILLVLAFIFMVIQWQKTIKSGHPKPPEESERLAAEKWEQEFLQKNEEQIQKLEEIASRLMAELPSLGVTSNEFNDGLQPMIQVLADCPTEKYGENWQVFQKNFAYAYEKWHKKVSQPQNLPKQVEDSQQKIIRILQELNQVIQSMNK